MTDDLTGRPLSVVINTYRRPWSVTGVAAAALEQMRAEDELLIVDDGSDDETLTVLESIDDPRVRVITQENQGLAAARNRGALEATRNVVLYLDDDETPQPGLVEAHRRAHARPGRWAVMGRPLLLVPHRGGYRQLPPGPRNTEMLVTDGSFSIRKSDLQAVGGYDVAMRGWEDIDLGIRLKGSGVALDVAPDALVTHAIDRPYAVFRRQRLERGRARALGIAKHGREKALAFPPRRAVDRALVAVAARSRAFSELAPLLLWIVVRVGGRVGSWRVQAMAAGRAGMILMARAESIAIRETGLGTADGVG